MLDSGPGSFFLTPAQLADSPSSRHGVPLSSQESLRFYACEIIQEAGILLRMPQVVMATAQVLLHRFFCKRSFRDFDARSIAASCFWLSTKLEEEGHWNRGEKPSRLVDVLNVFERIRARREGEVALAPDCNGFKKRKEELLRLETQILVELGFVCHVEHPHKFLLSYLNCLNASPKLVQEAWNLEIRRSENAVEASPLKEKSVEAVDPVSDSMMSVQPCQEIRRSEDAVEGVKNVSVNSTTSTSNLIKFCVINPPGAPNSNGALLGGILMAHRKFQSKGFQLNRELLCVGEDEHERDSEDTRRRSDDNVSVAHELRKVSRRRECRDLEDIRREGWRGTEHKRRRREDEISFHRRAEDRCSSRYNHQRKHSYRPRSELMRG